MTEPQHEDAPIEGSVGGGAHIRVTVDHELCSGTRQCELTAPDVFDVRDSKAYVRDDVDWDSVDTQTLTRAADGCPWFAIEVNSSRSVS